MYKSIIEQVEHIQRSRLLEISTTSNGNTLIHHPPKKCSGLYFFYTSYSDTDLLNAGKPPTKSAVPIADLAQKIIDLNLVLPQEENGFRLVYNGIGGYKGGSYDLRSRILQEILSTNPNTGSLCIRQTTLNDLSKWRFSYVIMPSTHATNVKSDIDAVWDFDTYALEIEKYWRFHYGWPLLSRQ